MSEIDQALQFAKKIGNTYTREWGEKNLPWFDHRYEWARGPSNWIWMERGILGHFCIESGDRVLDLCCGDGMFAGLCFSHEASVVHGIDRNSAAIDLATDLYGSETVKFFRRDILKDPFPLAQYDAIMWFQGIEHFSLEECGGLFEKIKHHLSLEGFLFGSTIIGHKDSNPEHQMEFRTPQDLKDLLESAFTHVMVWPSRWSENRTDLFFCCRSEKSGV